MPSKRQDGPPPPEYVAYDDKAREEFLSQHGSFAPEEREAFHRICRSWEPEIPLARIDEFLARGSLVKKLESAGLGVVTTRYHEGKRSPKGLVLTDEKNLLYWRTVLEEQYVSMQESIANPLPTLRVLQDQGITIPEEHISDIDFDTLLDRVGSPEALPSAIFRLDLGDGDRMLVPSSRVKTALTLAVARLRYHFQSANLLAEMARVMNTSVIELKQQVESKDLSSWKKVCDAVGEHRPGLAAKRNLAVDKHFFHAATFASRYLTGQMTAMRRRRDAESERSADIAAIEEWIRTTETFFVEPTALFGRLDELHDKYAGDFEAFKDAFFQEAVTARERRSLPRVLLINNRYIHRDNVYPAFRNDFVALGDKLRNQYLAVMRDYLKGNRQEGDRVFASEGAFEEDIADRVANENAFIGELFEKPSVLAEAIIHHAKKRKSVADLEELKVLLASYFQAGTMKLKDLSYIFGLSMLEIFDTAYRSTALFRQIWLKISGRAEALREAFARLTAQVYGSPKNRLGHSPGRLRSDAKAPAADTGATAGTRGTSQPAAPRRNGGSASRRPGGGATRRAPESEQSTGHKPRIIKQQRVYNEKQRDEAWENFKKTLRE